MSENRPPAVVAAATPAAPAYFISDLHLAANRPETTAAFRDFLTGSACNASSLWILGDFFEYWAGDDECHTPYADELCSALKALAARGTPLFFMRGNRDLLIGSGFAARTGVQLLNDPTLIELNGQRFLLSHGDILCTDDLPYQAYRRQVNAPDWQAAFLARPLEERLAFIQQLRLQSEQAKQNKSMTAMDVNTHAVTELLREYTRPALIHGHTHLPAHHLHIVDGETCNRWVLPEWHTSAGGLYFDGTCLHRFGT